MAAELSNINSETPKTIYEVVVTGSIEYIYLIVIPEKWKIKNYDYFV